MYYALLLHELFDEFVVNQLLTYFLFILNSQPLISL